MRRCASTVVLAACIGGPSAATAADCGHGGSVGARIQCFEQVVAREEARLDRVMARVMAEHPSGGDPLVHRKEIRAAQRYWLRFRDADCEARSKTGIPRYWVLNRLTCRLDMTRARIATLTGAYLR